MGGDADMSDLSGLFRGRQRFQRTAGGTDLLHVGWRRIVDLVQVNIVCAEVFQADIDVLRHGLRRAGHALGGKHEMFPNALKANA